MRHLIFAFFILLFGVQVKGQLLQTVTEYDGSSQGNGTTVAAQSNLVSSEGTLNSTDWASFEGASELGSLNNVSLAGGTEATALTAGSSPWTLTITLNTSDVPVNSLGYTITKLDAITGWSADYVGQNYTVSYSTVLHPTTFIPLINASTLGTSFTADSVATYPTQVSLLTSLTPTLSAAYIATNVAALQYTFSLSPNDAAAGDGHVEAYREIEAFGTPVYVPEPSTWALFLFGGIGLSLMAYRRARL